MFFSDQFDYLGYVILHGKLAISSKICEVVNNFKSLRTITDVRSFVGM